MQLVHTIKSKNYLSAIEQQQVLKYIKIKNLKHFTQLIWIDRTKKFKTLKL